ncbi:hypothetical protein GGR52DRAFT_472247 [Hypoxylon sp. FL1284]|nr:hypothetical protein GGR52DRAFT_472247 [Hypoxylon sp. FL1284]
MRDDRTHPLLAQVPLTVSPFVSLPTAATLPYTYKSMPSTLPATASGVTSTTPTTSAPSGQPEDKVRYVVSASGGAAAHPDDIAASCAALRAHVAGARDGAARALADLDAALRARELAERRRVAPGWLDSDARLLQPERSGSVGAAAEVPATAQQLAEMSLAERRDSGAISEMAVDQGEELDRAFGGWK